MQNTATPPVVLILPRQMREAIARPVSRIVDRGHGLSAAAARTVELLLDSSDRVELTPVQAATARAALNAARGRGVVPDSTLDTALRHLDEQLDQSAISLLAAVRLR